MFRSRPIISRTRGFLQPSSLNTAAQLRVSSQRSFIHNPHNLVSFLDNLCIEEALPSNAGQEVWPSKTTSDKKLHL